MKHLYNPENSKFVVDFCDGIQGQKLELYDPHLASIMSNAGILSHIYGLRWSRLLMGREFVFCQVLELWDYIFKSLYESTTTNDNNSIEENILDISERIMMAMLIRLRGVLAIKDMSESLAVLMKFPPLDNEDFRQSIIKVAERIKMRKIDMKTNNNYVNNNSGNNNSVLSFANIPSYDDMDNDKSSGNTDNNNNSNGNGDNHVESVKDSDRNGNYNEGWKYSILTEDMVKAKQQQQQQPSQSSRFALPNLPTLPQMNIPNLIPSMPNIQRPKWMKSSSNSNNSNTVTLNEISKRLSIITNHSSTLPNEDK